MLKLNCSYLQPIRIVNLTAYWPKIPLGDQIDQLKTPLSAAQLEWTNQLAVRKHMLTAKIEASGPTQRKV